MNYEHTYLNLLSKCYFTGDKCVARNDNTLALVNTTIVADCSDGAIPLLTTKKVNYRAAIVELLWFLRGDTNLEYLHDHGVHIWDQWADDAGNLGPVYGKQWGKQFDEMIRTAKDNPFSRRLLINSWQLDDLPHMALVPCHYAYQVVNTIHDGQIVTDLVVNMRSSDAFIGTPFNLVNYGVLLHIICNEIGTKPRNLYLNSGNFHIYESHIQQVLIQLSRSYNKLDVKQPRIGGTFNSVETYKDLTPDMFIVSDYEPQGYIQAVVLK